MFIKSNQCGYNKIKYLKVKKGSQYAAAAQQKPTPVIPMAQYKTLIVLKPGAKKVTQKSIISVTAI